MGKVTSIADKLPKAWKPDGFKLPKDLGACIDLLAKKYRARKKAEGQAETLKSEESGIKEHIFKLLQKENINEARGKVGVVRLIEKDVPRIERDGDTATGWGKLYKHVQKTGDFDLLQKRLGEAACQARWEAGQEIPGVEKYHQKEVKLTETK